MTLEELGSEVLRSSIQDLEEAPLSAPQEREIDPCYGHNSDRERQLGKENDWLPSGRRIKHFVVDNFLPLGFSIATVVALIWPQPGRQVAEWKVGNIRAVQAVNNSLVFLVNGLTLQSDDLKKALKNWTGVVYGILSILVITPCAGFLTQQLPFRPREFTEGLSIFCVMPTTLGVGIVVVAAARGNEALALFLTICTNILGILTIPFELKLVLQGSRSVAIDVLDLFAKLICTVLVPSLIGKFACSTSGQIRSFVRAHKVALTLFSTSNLVSIVWQTMCGARDVLLRQNAWHVLLLTCAVMVLHLCYLAFNTAAVWLLRLPLDEAVAVVIMSSQKAAPVAIAVISYVTPNIATQGLLSMPGLIGQLFQLFLGSYIAGHIAPKIPPSLLAGETPRAPLLTSETRRPKRGTQDSS